MAECHEAGEDAALATIVQSGDGSPLVAWLQSRATIEKLEISQLLEAALESTEHRREQKRGDQFLPPLALLR